MNTLAVLLYYVVYDLVMLSPQPLFWIFYYLNVTICAHRNYNLKMTRVINFQGYLDEVCAADRKNFLEMTRVMILRPGHVIPLVPEILII